MNRRLCLLPFHRKVKLTINDVLRMYQGLLRCDRNGGAVFVTSEHRLSLQLKGHELRLSEKGSGANSDSFERIHAKGSDQRGDTHSSGARPAGAGG
jgi:hypothetical protein